MSHNLKHYQALDELVTHSLLTQSEIEEGFDEANRKIKPLAMTVKTTRLKTLIEAMQAKGVYRVEIDHVDEQEVIHLLLHRTTP